MKFSDIVKTLGSATALSASLALGLMLFLVAPTKIFFTNVGEFSPGYLDYLPAMALGVIVTVVVCVLVDFLLDNKYSDLFSLSLLALAVIVIVQLEYFAPNYGVLDGSKLNFEGLWRDALVEMLVYLVLIVLAVANRAKILDSHWASSGLLLLVGALISVFYMATSPTDAASPPNREYAEKFEALTSISAQGNVIHLMPDTLQTDAVEQILRANPEFSSHFDGFTFFRNNLGHSMLTNFSLPTIFSGQDFFTETKDAETKYSSRMEEMFEYNLLDTMHVSGFAVKISSLSGYFASYFKRKAYVVIGDAQYHTALSDDPNVMLFDLALFASAPSILRPMIYRDDSWLLSYLVQESHDNDRQGFYEQRAITGMEFFENVAGSLKTNSEKPVYLFLHVWPPHPPFVHKGDCETQNVDHPGTYMQSATCAVRILVSLLERLKDSGAYDSSLVIIQADTGSNWVSEELNKNLKSISVKDNPSGKTWSDIITIGRPALLVKPPFATGPIQISNAAVSHSQTVATVLKTLNLKGELEILPASVPRFGFFDLPSEATRERTFFVNHSISGGHQVIGDYTEMSIQGDVNNPATWTRENR